MTIRRLLAASALLLAAVACQPSIEQQAPPAAVVTAVFDPSASQIPLPNALAIRPDVVAGLPAGAQKDLLQAFAAADGFPNDQEVAITISFVKETIHSDGTTTRSAPALDLASFGPDTFFVYGASTPSGPGEVELDPILASDYATVGDVGVLTLHHRGRQPWAPGEYFVFVRGGAAGVQTTAAEPVYPSQVFFLMEQGQDMTTEKNLSLLRSETGSAAAALALAQQLNGLIAMYGPAFAVADTRFPHQELAVLTTFKVAPAVTQVELDPARGLVPLPIDLMRDPRPVSAGCPSCGRITPFAACGLAGGTVSPTTGTCSSPAAAGFETLDGFGTSAPLLITTSDLIQAATVTPATVLLYDLSVPTAPVLVDPATYVTEPCEVTSSGLSPVIALQPAGASSCDATSPFRTRPLKDDTLYAVVIGDGVLDKTGKPLGRGTVAKILLFTDPLVDGSGASQLVGIDDATAYALDVMRQALGPVLDDAAAHQGLPRTHVAMAYTFKTQSITATALALTAAPYLVEQTPPGQAIFAVTGVAPHPSPPPAPSVSGFFDVTFNSIDAIDKTTGALRATLAADLHSPTTLPTLLTSLNGLVAVPKAANVPFCSGSAGPRCARVVVVGHGLGGSRETLLAVADALAAQGFIAVATDFPLHGSRAWCASSAECTAPGTCDKFPGGAGQGDQVPPGVCSAGSQPIPQISGQYFISANFFRTRDAFRQNLIDQSALVLAMARPPAPYPQPAVDARPALLPSGVVIDPSAVGYVGISLGSLAGSSVVATNPRLTSAVFNVGGATAVDVFTTSPAFASSVDALLAGLGIAPGTAAYLQFLAVAKTILDPADPVNFAVHLSADRLPDLLTPAAQQPPKAVLAQAALCDDTVPNVWNYLLASSAGLGPLPGATGFGGPGTFQLFLNGAPPTGIDAAIRACSSPTGTSPYAVTHGFFADGVDPAITAAAQSDAAAFLRSGALPLSIVDLP
jgi:hypothetical protein